MNEIFKPLSNEIYLDWIEQLIAVDDKLTVWECQFIGDLRVKVISPGFRMSERQHEILEQIYAEKTN